AALTALPAVREKLLTDPEQELRLRLAQALEAAGDPAAATTAALDALELMTDRAVDLAGPRTHPPRLAAAARAVLARTAAVERPPGPPGPGRAAHRTAAGRDRPAGPGRAVRRRPGPPRAGPPPRPAGPRSPRAAGGRPPLREHPRAHRRARRLAARAAGDRVSGPLARRCPRDPPRRPGSTGPHRAGGERAGDAARAGPRPHRGGGGGGRGHR